VALQFTCKDKLKVLFGLLAFCTVVIFFIPKLEVSTDKTDHLSKEPKLAAAKNSEDFTDSAINADQRFHNPYSSGPSIWQESLQEVAWNKLKNSEAELLIIPFQSSDKHHEFDASTRSLLTLTTANTLSTNGKNVADPLLVAEALGLNRSTFDIENITKLANDLNVAHVVISSIGHDNYENLYIDLSLFERDNSIKNENTEWSSLEIIGKVNKHRVKFSTTNLPYYWYVDNQFELLNELFDESFNTQKISSEDFHIQTDFPAENFINSETGNPLEAAKKLQFLALLHPYQATERTGRWLYERSLVELEKLDHTNESALLKATALAELSRRPMALNLLKNLPPSPEKDSVFNYANSNVVDSQILTSIKDPSDRIAAHIRNHRLRNAYKLKPENSVYSELEYLAPWNYLVYNALQDGHTWRDTESDYLKVFLDELNNDKSFSHKTIKNRQSINGHNKGSASIEKAILDHAKKIDQKELAKQQILRITDVMHVVRAQLAENIYDKIYKTAFTVGSLDVAIEQVEHYENVLSGQPDFSLAASEVYGNFAENEHITPQQSNSYLGKSAEFASAGFIHGNNPISRTRFLAGNLAEYDKISNSQKPRLQGATVWPYTCGVSYFFEKCLENVHTNFYILERAAIISSVVSKPEEFKQLLEDNHNRFVGHEDRLQFLHIQYQAINDTEGLNKLNTEIASGTTDWKILHSMATHARLNSKYDLAADIILQYPEFDNNVNISSVNASNRSYSIGSRMYWAGAHKAAARLFEKTASRNTGAASEASARARLATIEGNYLDAINHQYQIVQRYQSSYAMRDMLGLMVLIKDGKTALEYAHSFTPYLTKPHVWHGNFFAHRAGMSSLEEQADWVKSISSNGYGSIVQNTKENQEKLARYSNSYLFMSTFIDRSTDSISLKYLNEHRKDQAVQEAHYPTNETKNGWTSYYDQDFSIDSEGNIIPFPIKQLTAARVLNALYQGEAEEAEKLIQEGNLCDGRMDVQEFLWLCAWTASQTNKADFLTQRIEIGINKNTSPQTSIDTMGLMFDDYVSLALLKGFDGKHDEAISLLYKANADHLYTESRTLLVRYHLLEIAHILFESTGKEIYKSFVLEHARNYSVVDPFASYNYSYIARLSDESEERISALAFLQRLDPNSQAMDSANEDELNEAKKQTDLGPMIVSDRIGDDI